MIHVDVVVKLFVMFTFGAVVVENNCIVYIKKKNCIVKLSLCITFNSDKCIIHLYSVLVFGHNTYIYSSLDPQPL